MDTKLLIEIITIIGSVAAGTTAVLGVFWWIAARYSKNLRDEIKLLKREKDVLESKIDKVRDEKDSLAASKALLIKNLDDLGKKEQESLRQLASARTEHANQIAAYKSWKEDCLKRVTEHVASLKQKHSGEVADLMSAKLEVGLLEKRMQRAFQKDGQTWNEKVLANTPDFKPLDPEGRRTPIISILNLKGGVGKTTITANLGAALDAMGYRVLLLDLDLQGSLTSLFLSDTQQEPLYNDQRLLADFLAASFDKEFPNLRDYEQPILPDSKSAIVPTTDGLAYAETNLIIRWLLREGNRDPRFLLRKELQLKRITDNFDVVLMDCPPLINMCCVNALVASDYLLIPILPSIQATARVPVLLQRMKEFRENINSDLNVMGIITNRTLRSELTADEENRLSLLKHQCKDIIGHEVPQFQTFIRQNVEVRVAEDEHRPLRAEDQMHECFLELAREVESLLPTFCRPSKKVSQEVAV